MKELKEKRSILKKIQEIKTQNAPFYLWSIIRNKLTKIQIKIQNFDEHNIKVSVQVEDMPDFRKLINGAEEFDSICDDEYFVMKFKLISVDMLRGEANFSIQRCFEIERRQGERVEFSVPLFINFKVAGKEYKRKIHDISSGGLAFVLSNQELFNFKKGDLFPFLELIVGPQKILLSGYVINVVKIEPFKFENTPYGGKRISIKFEQCHPLAIQMIEDLIFHYKNIRKEIFKNKA